MERSNKIALVIYVWMFIFVKLFHCIDVNGDENGAEVVNESTNSTNTNTEFNSTPPDQITKQLDAGNQQPQENIDAMQMCNQSCPTPKGTVLWLCVYENALFQLE